MKLNLEKDLAIVDLETTGLSVTKDRIVQIAILKVFADGRPNELKVKLINPEIPISKEASEITGITDEMVKNEPTFKKLAKGVKDFLSNCDLCGFNSNRFDFPLLFEEFNRAGIDFDISSTKFIDVKRIFHNMEQRTLSAAKMFYCGTKMENAHDAGADVTATFEVLEAMLDKYKDVDYENKSGEIIKNPIQNNIESLYEFTKDTGSVDFSGTMRYDENNVPVFNFGKYQGKSVGEMLSKDKKYYDWIMNIGEFTNDTRKMIKKIVEEYKPVYAY